MSEPKWTMTLTISNGFETFCVADEIDRDVLFSGMSPRLRDEMTMAREIGLNAVSPTATVDMILRKEFRRARFISEMKRLGGKIANHMEDREGWHGVDRAEAANRRV